MIARQTSSVEKVDLWAQLAAPVPTESIAWRQDGRATQRDGKYFARFVCYIEANTVRERLDLVVPGEWDLTLELLPTLAGEVDPICAFKARLQILGVVREDVGHGTDYKSAATDAFKRVAVRFGIGHELYGYEQNWVRVDGDGKFAKPLEDPAEAYARRHSKGGGARATTVSTHAASTPAAPARVAPSAASPTEEPTSAPYPPGDHIDDRAPLDHSPHDPSQQPSDEATCPKCGGRMWDNRLSKRNPKAPDFKCRSRSCDGVIWPPKQTGGQQSAKLALVDHDQLNQAASTKQAEQLLGDDDDLPF